MKYKEIACKYLKVKVLVTQTCPTLAVDPPGSSICRNLQVRILEWVAIPFSRGSSQPRYPSCVSCIGRQILYCLNHEGSYFLIF